MSAACQQLSGRVEHEVGGGCVHARDLLGADAQIARAALEIGDDLRAATVQFDLLRAGRAEDDQDRDLSPIAMCIASVSPVTTGRSWPRCPRNCRTGLRVPVSMSVWRAAAAIRALRSTSAGPPSRSVPRAALLDEPVREVHITLLGPLLRREDVACAGVQPDLQALRGPRRAPPAAILAVSISADRSGKTYSCGPG